MTLKCSKEKIVCLVSSFGYDVPADASFSKKKHFPCWFLEWHDTSGSYFACLSSYGSNRAYFYLRSYRLWDLSAESFSRILSYDLLRIFDLVCED